MQAITDWKPSLFKLNQLKLEVNTHHPHLSRAAFDILRDKADQYSNLIPQYAKGRLLDLGCGNLPLFALYQKFASEVIAVDWGNSLHKNPHLDFEMDLNSPLLFEDSSFDTIICSDVIEHLEMPELIFSEMHRILKPGGVLLLNVPFMYWIHEAPYDHFRYTEFTLKRLAQKHGFHTIQCEPTGGAVPCMVDILNKSMPKAGFISASMFAFTRVLLACVRIIPPLKTLNSKSRFKFPQAYYCVFQKS